MTSLLLTLMLASAPASLADLVPPSPPPAAASGASGSIDPEAATRAYLDLLPADQRAKSDAYFEGGYWLTLWSFLWGAGVFLLLLQTGASARMRDFAERVTRVRALQTALYWTQFVVAVGVLSFPLSVYQDYLREHSYGLSNLTFGGWFVEQLKGLALSIVLGGLAMMVLYAVVRRLPRTWWLWSAAVAVAFAAFAALITPIFIVPIFNSPKMSASASCTRTIELKTGVTTKKYAVNSSAASGNPATSPTSRTRHRPSIRTRGRSNSHATTANPATIKIPISINPL